MAEQTTIPQKPVINKEFVTIIVQNRQGILIQEDAKALTSYNEQGIFDVLPEHTNFISIIKDNLIIHRKNGEKKEIKVNQGLLRVQENQIHVYLDVIPNAENT